MFFLFMCKIDLKLTKFLCNVTACVCIKTTLYRNDWFPWKHPAALFPPKISTVQLKRLRHGCLVHFVNNVTYTLLNVMELTLCVNGKITASCHANMSLRQYFKCYKQST